MKACESTKKFDLKKSAQAVFFDPRQADYRINCRKPKNKTPKFPEITHKYNWKKKVGKV